MPKRMGYNTQPTVGTTSRDNTTRLTPAPSTGRPRGSRRPAKGNVKAGPHTKA